MTPVPVHTPIRTPGASASPSHTAGPATPHQPGSPQATPGDPNQQHPQQDSLQDIRSDLDHHPGGLTDPDPADQQALADAVPHNEDGTPQRFPDPFGHWSQLQNDGGNTVPGRSNNCADCSRSFLETWYGNPQVSAPRTLDTDANGNPDVWSPESNANANQIRWTGAAHTYAGPGNNPDTANNIADTLQQAGHGSAAIVQVDWPGGGGHAFNAVNHHGKIIWIDTQSGQVSNQPLHIDQAAHVWHIPLDANRNPIDTSQPHTGDSATQNDASQKQDDASGDAPNPGDHIDAGASSKSASPTNAGEANRSEPPRPPMAEPSTTPDATSGEPEGESSRPQTNSNSPSEANSTAESRDSSQGTPDSPRPAPDDSGADQQRPHETASQRDHSAPTEPPSTSYQPDFNTEHKQPPADTTADGTLGGESEKTIPGQTATGHPNGPTANRDTPQHGTTSADARTSTDQQSASPGTAHPRTADPRTSEPRSSEPRTLDSHRRPPEHKTPEAGEHPVHQRANTPPRPNQTSSGQSDRRTPNAPAGADTGGNHEAPSERPRGSAAYDASQGPHDTHYGMLPEPSQAHLRETNEVTQTDLTPVYDRIREWSNNGDLSSLMGDRLAEEQGGIRKSTLIDALPGFADLTEGQQGAVVAALARMDLRFHATSAVGAALDHGVDNPNSPANFTPHTTDPEKIERSNAARKVIGQLMDKAGIKSAGLHYHAGKAIPGRAALTEAIHQRISEGEGLSDSEIAEAVQHELQSLNDHKGDWSRKNFAVIEVRDPENNHEIRYVVDSSLPMSSAWGAGVHSEPHAMEWIKAVNAKREAAGASPFEPVSLYTEREPCGHASGNDCSGYISDEIEEGKEEDQLQEGEKKNRLHIHYGVGFRRGQIADDADLSNDDGTTSTVEEAKEEARKKFTSDFNNHVNRLRSVWEGNAKAGGLSN